MSPPEPAASRDLLPLRAVIDACVFPRTRRWLVPLIDAARNGYVILLWSPLVIAETNRLLTWLWLQRRSETEGRGG